MKIIGRGARATYIVEATEQELKACAGRHYYDRDMPGWSPQTGAFSIGTDIDVVETHQYLAKLRDNEDKIRQSETLLRALADMLHTALPTTIIPPSPEAESV